MRTKHFAILSALFLSLLLASPVVGENATQVTLETNHGAILLELYPDKAPKTVANFLEYVRAGFFDGTIFHRVIDGFMVQGGGFTSDLQQKIVRAPIPNEAKNGLANDRGTVAMARTGDPHSATAQFFINHADNDFLNQPKADPSGWGYAVFGRVIEGMDVVDVIAKVQTGVRNGMSDVPVETVTLTKATAN